MNAYNKLDLNKLKFATTAVSYEDATKNITPFNLSQDIITGKKSIQITKAQKDYDKQCVKLEIYC